MQGKPFATFLFLFESENGKCRGRIKNWHASFKRYIYATRFYLYCLRGGWGVKIAEKRLIARDPCVSRSFHFHPGELRTAFIRMSRIRFAERCSRQFEFFSADGVSNTLLFTMKHRVVEVKWRSAFWIIKESRREL